MPAISSQQITEWRTKIQDTQCEHTHSLGRQLGQIEKLNRDKTTSKSLSEAVTRFEKKLATSIEKVDGFKAAALNIQFPEHKTYCCQNGCGSHCFRTEITIG